MQEKKSVLKLCLKYTRKYIVFLFILTIIFFIRLNARQLNQQLNECSCRTSIVHSFDFSIEINKNLEKSREIILWQVTPLGSCSMRSAHAVHFNMTKPLVRARTRAGTRLYCRILRANRVRCSLFSLDLDLNHEWTSDHT